MIVNYGIVTDDNKVINKHFNIIGSINAELKYSIDLMSPILILSGGYFNTDFNYISCDVGGRTRYYYVTDKTLSGSICNVKLKEDVLMTFKTDILNSSGLIVRSLNGSEWINDPMATQKENNAVFYRNMGTCFESGVSYIWLIAS